MAPSEKKIISNRIVLGYLWKRFWSYPFLASATLLTVVVGVLTQILSPWYLKKIIDSVATLPPSSEAAATLWPTLAALFVLWGVEWMAWRGNGWLTTTFQPRVMRDIEVGGFSYLLGHSYKFFSDEFTGTLVRRVRRMSRSFEELADAFQFQFIPATIVLVGAIIALGLRSPLLAWIFFGWCALLIGLSVFGSFWKLKLDVLRAAKDSELTGALSDAITNATTIKVFTGVQAERKRFETISETWRSIQTRAWQRGEVIFTVQGGLMAGIHIIFFVFGIQLWSRGKLTVGDLVLIHSYLQLVFHNLWDIGRALRRVYESLADAREMVEILELPYGVKDKRGAKTLKVTKGALTFKDVTFAFHQTRQVLKNFSLTIAPGEKIALVGPSGAGKSTVTKLLFRFYDLDSGKILIDGQNIADVSQDGLRQQIALVPQESILFHRTLRENILYGRPGASEKEMLEASKKAHCHEFIMSLPDGYESYVGERGVKLSGGERQRIAIARAILKDAPILVLDEATSSLDSESEHYIQDALRILMKKKTVIVIAHRLSTIMEMDRIAVIEHGQVTATGTHEELLRQTGTYKRLWDIQAGGFITEEEDVDE